MKKLIIIGAAEPGHEILDILKRGTYQQDLEFYRFYDDFAKGDNIVNALTSALQGCAFISSLGNVGIREQLYQRFIEHRLIPASVFSSDSWIAPSAEIGNGVVVYPLCNISSHAVIGDNVLINFQSSVSHGVHVGANSNLCPGTRIAGNVTLGKNVYVGIGSVIKEKVSVCDNVLIGAHSTVLRDIDKPGVYVGSPCRFLRSHPAT